MMGAWVTPLPPINKLLPRVIVPNVVAVGQTVLAYVLHRGSQNFWDAGAPHH